MTEELIESLARDLKPVSPHALVKLLGLAIAAGLVLSAAAMIASLGLRPDLAEAMGGPYFWIKFVYTLGLGAMGAWAASRISRPGETGRRPLAIAVLVVLLMGIVAVVSYTMAPPSDRRTIVMGSSALVCPFYIIALSLPLLLTAIVFLRRMAPTHPTQAGLVAGLMAGGLGACVYSLHCTEWGVPFLALWYSLGIAVVALIGALTGRVLLRW
jgi:hypothetical protein